MCVYKYELPKGWTLDKNLKYLGAKDRNCVWSIGAILIHICVYVYMCICVCVYMCMCVYVYVCIKSIKSMCMCVYVCKSINI